MTTTSAAEGERPVASPRARRHPWAIIALWAWHLGVAGRPLRLADRSAAVGSVFSRSPEGEGLSWEPGGAALMRLVDREDAIGSAGMALFFAFLAASAVLDLVPVAALYADLACAPPAGRSATRAAPALVARGVEALPTFAALLVAYGAAQIGVATSALWLWPSRSPTA